MEIPESFEFFTPTRIIFGAGAAEKDLPAVIAGMKPRKILLVTDAGVVKAGHADKIAKASSSSGAPCVLFDRVTQDTRIETVREGIGIARSENTDLVIGLGGGSSLDAAKVISLLLKHGGDVYDYEGVGVIPDEPMTPLIGIPTTAGTGSEVTAAALVSDAERGEKISLIGPRLTSDVAIIDPEMTVTMPPHVTASTGMDVIAHAVEGVVSLMGNPVVEAVGLRALRLAAANLTGAVADGANLERRGAMALASVMAGICIRHAIAGAAHAMAHAAGGMFHVPHGAACGMFLADVMEFNLDFAPSKYKAVAHAMGINVYGLDDAEAGRKAVEKVRNMYAELGLPESLREFGVKPADVDALADKAFGDGCVIMNPRPLEPDDFKVLFGKFL